MKRVYFSPVMEVVGFSTDAVMTTSRIEIDDNPTTNPAANRQQGKWGDVWNK